METQEYEHIFVNIQHVVESLNMEMCEPLEIMQLDGKLVAFFILN